MDEQHTFHQLHPHVCCNKPKQKIQHHQQGDEKKYPSLQQQFLVPIAVVDFDSRMLEYRISLPTDTRPTIPLGATWFSNNIKRKRKH